MEETGQMRALAEVATTMPERYLGQLCKHFAHKIPVTQAERSGRIGFPMGECRLKADEGVLVLSVAAAQAEHLAQLQDVIARHLLRFAFREELQVVWRQPG